MKGKHQVAEIEGVRCSVVETGLHEERKAFLTGLLQQNGYEVKCEHEKAKDGTVLDTYILGVTDLLFNPVIRLYQQKLYRTDHLLVTPAFWEEKKQYTDIPYWQVPR